MKDKMLIAPSSLLEKIKGNQNQKIQLILPTADPERELEHSLHAGIVELIRITWQECYWVNNREMSRVEFFKADFYKEFSHNVLLSVGELIKNAFEHGNGYDKSKVVSFAFWFTPHGIVLGCKDEGVFFSKKETVLAFKKKESFDSTSLRESSCNAGINIFYEDSDAIEVDSNQNSIFLAFILKQ